MISFDGRAAARTRRANNCALPFRIRQPRLPVHLPAVSGERRRPPRPPREGGASGIFETVSCAAETESFPESMSARRKGEPPFPVERDFSFPEAAGPYRNRRDAVKNRQRRLGFSENRFICGKRGGSERQNPFRKREEKNYADTGKTRKTRLRSRTLGAP